MNKIFLLFGVCASLFAQTLDINALRMAQSRLGSKGIDNGSITNERQVQQKIIYSKPKDDNSIFWGGGVG